MDRSGHRTIQPASLSKANMIIRRTCHSPDLKKKLEKRPPLSRGHAAKIVDLFESASRFFLCITNRRNPHEDEKGIHHLGYAVAWERFDTGLAMNITLVARASD